MGTNSQLIDSDLSPESSMSTLFPDGGEMGRRVRQYDWTNSLLGPVSTWSSSLVATLNLVLSSAFPMVLYWGNEHIVLYNDGYISIFGARHPAGFGQPYRIAWAEIWDVIFPMFERVMRHGEATWCEDALLLLTRNGYLEEAFFTWSFTPIRDETGKVAGVLSPITETTKRVFGELQLSTLRELGTRALNVENLDHAANTMADVFTQHCNTLPFTLLYLIDKTVDKMILKTTSGFSEHFPQADYIPPVIDLLGVDNNTSLQRIEDEENPKATFAMLLKKVVQTRECSLIEDLEKKFGSFPGGHWPESPRSAMICPLSGQEGSARGVLVIGTNPRRALDDDYKGFLELVAGQVWRAIMTAEAYETVKKRAEMLAEIDRTKTIFFSNVSHEFRTPLTLMLGPLEESLTDPGNPLTPTQKERQNLIHRNTRRLLKLVNSLADFSRIEANRMQAIYEPLDITQLTADLASMFRSAMEKAGLEFIVDIPNTKMEVYLDKEMYENIIFNLLSNAFKFTLKGGIFVRLKSLENGVELAVQDTGVGISQEHLPHLFERFYRVENSQGRSYEGTGIGLALVAELVKFHHASIQVESELGHGTTFRIIFPLGHAHLPTEHLGKREAHQIGKIGADYVEEALHWLPESLQIFKGPTSLSKPPSSLLEEPKGIEASESQESSQDYVPKILVVDDNSDMRSYLKSLLSPLWRVVTASNGKDALAFASEADEAPDLILSDVMMPCMDGPQFVQELRKNHATRLIPVILLSARTGEESRVEGLRTGADDYMVKPFSSKKLLARIQLHLQLGQLRIELDRLTTLAPVGIFRVNKHGICSYVNPAFTAITGLSMEELKVKPWTEFIHPEDREHILAKWPTSHCNLPFQEEFRIFRPDQKVTPVFVQLVSDRKTWCKEVGYIGVVDDLTLREQLHEAKMEALRKAEEHQRLRAEEADRLHKKQIDFIDTICHEIRNPLNGIDGSLHLMKDHLQELQQNLLLQQENYSCEWLSYLQSSVNKLNGFINDVLDCTEYQTVILNDVLNLSKLEANKIVLEKAPFDVIKTIHAAIRMYSGIIQQKDLNLTLDLPSEPVLTKGDPNRLKQILLNFISNSVKFTQVGEISVTLRRVSIEDQTKEQYKFVIKDTGIGMSREEIQHLFERYWQGTTEYSSKGKGSGLGLPISKRLIELMGGSIEVQSEKNKGTTFSFTILCKLLTQEEAQAFATAESARRFMTIRPARSIDQSCNPPAKPLRVLIVEDNPINQKVLLTALQRSGFDCGVANNGQEAIQQFLTFAYDVILMDIEMPLMNGFEATKQIRQIEQEMKRSPIPIICLSGNARGEHKEKAFSAGMNDYITKPFKKEIVISKIQQLMPNPDTPPQNQRKRRFSLSVDEGEGPPSKK